MSTWPWHDLVTLVLCMLGTGTICGIPIGVWITHLPVPTPPPSDEELGWLAEDLEQAAAMIRARAMEKQ